MSLVYTWLLLYYMWVFMYDDITITSHLYRARMGATVGEDSHTEMRLQYFFTARNTKLPLEKVYIIFRIIMWNTKILREKEREYAVDSGCV